MIMSNMEHLAVAFINLGLVCFIDMRVITHLGVTFEVRVFQQLN